MQTPRILKMVNMLNRNGRRAVLEMNLIARRNLQFQLKRASVLGDTFHGSGQALEHDRSIQIGVSKQPCIAPVRMKF